MTKSYTTFYSLYLSGSVIAASESPKVNLFKAQGKEWCEALTPYQSFRLLLAPMRSSFEPPHLFIHTPRSLVRCHQHQGGAQVHVQSLMMACIFFNVVTGDGFL